MQASFYKSALLLSLLGLSAAQSSCPAPVTVTVTVGGATTSSPATTTSSSAPCATAAAVPGYTTEWSCQNAAADGAGYVNYFQTDSLDPNVCAGYCGANSACQFFNVYQETTSDGSINNICVLWSQDKPLSTVYNSYNNGRPVSNSAGYSLNPVASSAVTTSAAATTSSAISSTSTTTTSTSALITPSVTDTPVSGYTLEWSQQTAAANCAGYITSNVADVWNPQACADQCTANAQCAFFNVYQQQVGSTFNYVCVIWGQDQPLNCATNSYNNGQPITASGGYLKIVPKVSTSSSSSIASTTSTSTSSTVSTTSSKASSSTVAATTTTSSSSSSTTTSSSTVSSTTTTSSTSTRATTTSVSTTTSAARTSSTTLSTSTRATTTTSSASLCPNGSPVPTQCAGQNQFIVSTSLNGVARWLAFSPSVNNGQTYLTTSRSAATVYYFDDSIGRLRTCPCAGVPYYRYPNDDSLYTNNFRMTLSNGVQDGSYLNINDAVTKAGIYWKAFDGSSYNLGMATSSTNKDPAEGAILALCLDKVTV